MISNRIWCVVAYLVIGIVCGIVATAIARDWGSDAEDAMGLGFIVTFMWPIMPVVLLMLVILNISGRIYVKAADWILDMIKRLTERKKKHETM